MPISQRRVLYLGLLGSGAAAIVLLGALGLTRAFDRNALWTIVHDQCVPNQQQHADPAPCARVDLQGGVERGYVILKDIVGHTQYLLIATAHISGIESPELLQPGARTISPPPGASAASPSARRAIPCRALRSVWRSIPPTGAARTSSTSILIASKLTCSRHCGLRPLASATPGRHFPSRWPDTITVRSASSAPHSVPPIPSCCWPTACLARAAMGAQNLVVVGADFGDAGPGFVILNATSDISAGPPIRGEELQDHSCALAHE